MNTNHESPSQSKTFANQPNHYDYTSSLPRSAYLWSPISKRLSFCVAFLSFVSEPRQLIQLRWFGLFRFLNIDFVGPPCLVLLRMMRSGRPSSCRMILVSSFLLIDRNDRPHLIVARFLRLKFMKFGTRIQKIRTCALLGICLILFQIIRALFKLHFLFLLLLFRFFVVFLFYVWC